MSCFVDHYLSLFFLFFCGNCIVCPSSIYVIWLPLWHLLTMTLHDYYYSRNELWAPNRYKRFYFWVDISASGLVVHVGTIHSGVIAAALAWFIRYTCLCIDTENNYNSYIMWFTKTKVYLPQTKVALADCCYHVLIRHFRLLLH